MGISVIIPHFNQGPYIRECLDSIHNQTFKDVEIIIVDDASDDLKSREEIDSLRKDSRYTVIQNKENRGVSFTRNCGISAAKYDYILPIDADDTLAPTMLEKTKRVLDTQVEVGVAYTNVRYFGDRNEALKLPAFDIKKLLQYNLLVSCALFRKIVWEKAGGYSEEFQVGLEDWDFWLAVAKEGFHFERVEENLFNYRYHVTEKSRNQSFNQAQEIAIIKQMILRHSTLYMEHLGSLIGAHLDLLAENKSLKSQFLSYTQLSKICIGKMRLLILGKLK